MDPAAIIRARQSAFQSQWVANPLVPVVVESSQALETVLRRNVEGASVDVTRIERFGDGSVVLARSDPIRSVELDVTCWTNVAYGNYASAFGAFLRVAYGLDTRPSVAKHGFDVDHLLNRRRSQISGLWVRLEASPSAVNQAWGGTFERHASDSGVYANTTRSRRTACYGIAAKMAAIMPPKSMADEVGIERICAHFRSILPPSEPDPTPGVRDYLTRIYSHETRVVIAVVDWPGSDILRQGLDATSDAHASGEPSDD